MGFVNIDCVREGMVLASDLMTPEGRFLLARGAILKESTIKTCKAWGVLKVDIAGQDQDQLNEARLARFDQGLLDRSLAMLQPLLPCANQDHPAMGEVVRLAVEQTALKLNAGEKPLGYGGAPPGKTPEEPCGGASPNQERAAQPSGTREALRLVQNEMNLISLPATFYKIMEVMESPFSSAFHIADVVSKDTSLSVKLLKLVNSAFYGFSSKIDSISRAVTLLGTKELTSLALGISVMDVFEGIPPSLINMEAFWQHSISCAVFAGLIASSRQGLKEESFFVAGMLHDLGRLLMIKSKPGDCAEAMRRSRAEGQPVIQVEQEVFGFDHALAGGLLCREWKLPGNLEQMVRFHHEPCKAQNRMESGIIHLANTLAMATGSGASGEGVIPPLDPDAWQSLELEVSQLAPMVQQSQRQILEIVHIFIDREP